ncbi:hypothetical protein ACOJBO_37205 [Rhizobium beringeri]
MKFRRVIAEPVVVVRRGVLQGAEDGVSVPSSVVGNLALGHDGRFVGKALERMAVDAVDGVGETVLVQQPCGANGNDDAGAGFSHRRTVVDRMLLRAVFLNDGNGRWLIFDKRDVPRGAQHIGQVHLVRA